MAEENQNTNNSASSFDPSIQSEKLAFDPQQMVKCLSCNRNNPPNRLACLYCGSVLNGAPLATENIKPGLRKPDVWEAGFNLISAPPSNLDTVNVAGAAKILSLELAVLESILSTPLPLPVGRYQSESDAAAVRKMLAGLGVQAVIVGDQALSEEKPPIRLAGVYFLDTQIAFITFNSQEECVLPVADIVLMVEGAISVSKVDQIEKRKLGGKAQSQGEVSTIYDEPILDIYSRNDTEGFRIQTSGFDFSCLGDEKGLLAGENLKKLTAKFARVSANAKLVSDYRSLRSELGYVWEVEMRRDTKGIQQTGIGKREFGSVTSTSNLGQFTKFSRLQRLQL
ncbi:hypothetical protein BH20ACI2_BH20ACI2_02880 [soil metagenome]